MDRWYWIDSFKNLNLPTAEIMNTNEEEFLIRSQFLTEAGLAPSSAYKERIKKNHTNNSTSVIDNNVITQQNEEYDQALKKDKITQEMKRMEEFRENLKSRIEEEKREENIRNREENRKKAEQLNNEGNVQIAFLFPSGKRVLHKFPSGSLGEDLFSFVAAQEEMYTEDCTLKEFRLLHGLNTDVQHEYLLEEQCISNRDMIKVICE
jgi:hypothetical protein